MTLLRMLYPMMFALTLCIASSASSTVLYNEATAGDLSGSGLSPTSLGVLSPGSNQILGSTGNVGGTDRDYFSISVPNGYFLAALIELPGTQSGGPLDVSFIGLEEGPQLTLPPNTTTAAGLLGWWHYSPANINSNLLTLMSVRSQGSSGFSVPLHPGTYTFWVQDFSPGTFAYAFDLQVIPEPATAALTLLALAACALSTRRRSHRSLLG